MNDVRVTVADARRHGFCVRNGIKVVCEQNGIDFRRFVKEGIPVSEIVHIEDFRVQQAISTARARVRDGG